MIYTPQSLEWRGTRAIFLVHGIGEGRTGRAGPGPDEVVRGILGAAAASTAIYTLSHDFVAGWLPTMSALTPGLAALKSAVSDILGRTEADRVIADLVGDLLWPALSPDLRFAMRDAFISQLQQIHLDRSQAAHRRGHSPLRYPISIVAHGIGCFYTYEGLMATAQEPEHELRPASDLATYDSVVLMASPLQMIRNTLESFPPEFLGRPRIATLEQPLDIPSETRRSHKVRCTEHFISVTGDHDPVGGHLVGLKLPRAYMNISGQKSIVMQQSDLNLSNEEATASALAEAYRTHDPVWNNPHSWTAYLRGNKSLLRSEGFAAVEGAGFASADPPSFDVISRPIGPPPVPTELVVPDDPRGTRSRSQVEPTFGPEGSDPGIPLAPASATSAVPAEAHAVDAAAQVLSRSRAREVFPDIATETPHPVAGAPLTMTVSLGVARSSSTRGSAHVPAINPETSHTLRVHLLLGEVSAWDTLEFSLSAGTAKPAIFTVTTPAIGERRRFIEARVNFYLNHRWCGEGSRFLEVRQSTDVPQTVEIPLPPAPKWRDGLALDADATAPDLIVRIQRSSSIGEYIWSCQSPHVDVTSPATPGDSRMALGEDAAAFVRRTFGPLSNISLDRLSIAAIQGVGESIYRSAPAHFKDSYWAVWNAAMAGGFPFLSIQVVTDEPFVPWELMRVYDAERGKGVKAEFLAIRHNVGRWLASESSGPPQRIPVSDIVVSASDYTGIAAVGNTLPWAKRERDQLVLSHHATVVPLTSDAVLQMLEEGEAQAVHFACHGRMSIADPNASQLVMEDTPKDVTPPLVARAEVCEGLGMNRPIVFLNACEVGGAANSLSLVAGFPAAFLYAGASALISPLWVVNDERAASIANEFYDAVFTSGGRLLIGEYLRSVRARWTDEKHLTYLAYVLYGDPLSWIDYAPRELKPTRPEAS